MKKLLLTICFITSLYSVNAQTINCTSMCVLDISLDTANDEMDVTIYNGDTNHVNYPTVVVVDPSGDTVGNINNEFYLFAQMGGTTVVHSIPTTLTDITGFTGTVYFTDQVWDTTCVFSYPMICSVGIDSEVKRNSVSVFPNPASEKITIIIQDSRNSNAQIILTDITGKKIRSYITRSEQFIIERNDLQSGMYFISVLIDDEYFVNKVVID
jgi:hypothetical protein